MAVTKNQIDRYYILDEIFHRWQEKWYTQEELLVQLNEALQLRGIPPISKRTLQADIKNMTEGECQAPIAQCYINRKRCYQYSDPHFSMRSQQLSGYEKSMISNALSMLSSFEGRPELEWLNKLGPLLNHHTDVSQARKVLGFEENPDLHNRELISLLYVHILAKTPLRITYRPFHKDEEMHFYVSPQYLKQYNNRWFLLTKSAPDTDLRILPLDRITHVEQTQDLAYETLDIDYEDYFYDIIGVTHPSDTPLQKVVLWVHPNRYPYIHTKPIHPSQKTIKGDALHALHAAHPHLTDGIFISIQLIPNFELLTQLLSYGADLCVISPSKIAQEMQKQIDTLHHNYQNSHPNTP